MKIKLKKSGIKNLIVPVDGLITIDVNGVAEVSEECSAILLTQADNWEVVEDKNKKVVTKVVDEKTTGVDNQGEGNEDNTENTEDEDDASLTDEEVIANIKEMSLEDAIDFAQEAGYPEEEWGKMKSKANLISAYLIKKFKQAKK